MYVSEHENAYRDKNQNICPSVKNFNSSFDFTQ